MKLDTTAQSGLVLLLILSYGDREIFICPVQLTTTRTGNLTRLILTLVICDDHTYVRS